MEALGGKAGREAERSRDTPLCDAMERLYSFCETVLERRLRDAALPQALLRACEGREG